MPRIKKIVSLNFKELRFIQAPDGYHTLKRFLAMQYCVLQLDMSCPL